METASDITIEAPATSSGRMLKTSVGRERSLSEERLKFIEEECDVSFVYPYHDLVPCCRIGQVVVQTLR